MIVLYSPARVGLAVLSEMVPAGRRGTRQRQTHFKGREAEDAGLGLCARKRNVEEEV